VDDAESLAHLFLLHSDALRMPCAPPPALAADACQVDDTEPLSPTEALVQGVVGSIFRRVLAANSEPLAAAAELSPSSAHQQQQGGADAEGKPLSPSTAYVRQLVAGIFARVVQGAEPKPPSCGIPAAAFAGVVDWSGVLCGSCSFIKGFVC
jgi:hypothetical protein